MLLSGQHPKKTRCRQTTIRTKPGLMIRAKLSTARYRRVDLMTS